MTAGTAAKRMSEHAGVSVAECRWAVHCALCGDGLPRWYYAMRAPMCVWCHGADGPVLDPALWEMSLERVGVEARRVWESYVSLVAAKDPSQSPHPPDTTTSTEEQNR